MPPLDRRTVLDAFDYTRALDRDEYKKKLDKFQGRLNLLMRAKKMRDRSLVVVFEGMDAAGKGSTIRRITQALDARYYRVIPIAAPTEEERAQPYLWRFWRHVPGHGRAAIFDRSWYGRVLVERVEGFAAEPDWMRAYHEINDFEEQLTEAGAIVVKFWLAITPAGAAAALQGAREDARTSATRSPPEDWRNRKKWPAYERAVNDMVERTSTEIAPWNVIASGRQALRAHRGAEDAHARDRGEPLGERQADAVAAENVRVVGGGGEAVGEDHAQAAFAAGLGERLEHLAGRAANGLKGGARSS